jgi:hypothetical protein
MRSLSSGGIRGRGEAGFRAERGHAEGGGGVQEIATLHAHR